MTSNGRGLLSFKTCNHFSVAKKITDFVPKAMDLMDETFRYKPHPLLLLQNPLLYCHIFKPLHFRYQIQRVGFTGAPIPIAVAGAERCCLQRFPPALTTSKQNTPALISFERGKIYLAFDLQPNILLILLIDWSLEDIAKIIIRAYLILGVTLTLELPRGGKNGPRNFAAL